MSWVDVEIDEDGDDSRSIDQILATPLITRIVVLHLELEA